MKISEEILESSGELVEYSKFYIDRQLYYAKLEVAERTASLMSSMITAAVVGVMALLVMVFLTIGMGFYLTAYFDSHLLGFGSMALFYVFMVLVTWVFRRQLITNPVVSTVIQKMFE